MKKIFYFFTLIIFPLFFCSCSMNVDEMVKDLNNSLYEDTGDGNFWTENGPNISLTLIEDDVYSVNEKGIRIITVNKGYFEYKWTLTDTVTKEEIFLGDYSTVYIDGPLYKLVGGRDYKLKLLVKNGNNLLFMDEATVKVVK